MLRLKLSSSTGQVSISDQEIELNVALGMLMLAFSRSIESAILGSIDENSHWIEDPPE